MKLAENAIVHGAIMRRLLFALLPGALAVSFPLAANAAYPDDFPVGVPSDAVWLTRSDGKVDDVNYYSLLTNYPTFWSDGAMIQDTDTDKVCFIPAGLTARTGTKAATASCVKRSYNEL